MEAFLCCADYSHLPQQLASFRNACQVLSHTAWEMIPGLEITVLRGRGRQWQRERRIEADCIATGEQYWLIDDDSVPLTGAWAHAYSPDFAIASAMPVNANISKWTPESYEPLENEHHSVGGVRLCKRGAMEAWPDMTKGSNGYDSIQCGHLRMVGKRVGYIPHLQYIHLGEGVGRSSI